MTNRYESMSVADYERWLKEESTKQDVLDEAAHLLSLSPLPTPQEELLSRVFAEIVNAGPLA